MLPFKIRKNIRSYLFSKGTRIGALWNHFYTDSNGNRKIKLCGYVILGVFSGSVSALELVALPSFRQKTSSGRRGKEIFTLLSRRQKVGWLVKEYRLSEKDQRMYHFFRGKVVFGENFPVKIRVLSNLGAQDRKDNSDRAPDYLIYLVESIKCAVVTIT